MIKSEENTGQQLVKRQRTDIPAATVGFSATDDGNQNQQQFVQASSADDTTTARKSSKYRGVSRHRWTGRYEAHLWDKLSWNATRNKKGRQVYLGAYNEEEAAARAYDLASLKYCGAYALTNFPISRYEREIQFMQTVTKEEYLSSLRRNSSGFSRGASKYRGVARHHNDGRWEARIGRIFRNKYLYLGTYNTQEEAAQAYDIAAIEYRGINAVTNFDLSTYIRRRKPEPIPQMEVQKPPQTVKQPHTEMFTINYFHRDESKPSLFNNQPFTVDYLNSPQKQELPQTSVPLSSSSSSSTPTALGLLFQSSMFRELVEKNSSVIKFESAKDDTKNQQVEIGRHEGDFFYGGMIPFGSASGGERTGLQKREFQFMF